MRGFSFDTTRWVPFYNNEGSEIPAHAVMRIVSDSAYEPDGHPYLKCEKPDTTFDRMYAVNGPTIVPAGAYGVCAILGSGPVLALCDASADTPTVGQQWGPEPSSWSLRKDDYGFICYGGADGATESSKALFQPVEIKEILGYTDGALSQNSSTSVDVYYGDDVSPAATGRQVTAYDWLLDTGQSVPDNTECGCWWLSGAWYLMAAKC